MELSSFPANMLADLMGFKRAAFFEADEQSMEAPAVRFTGRDAAAPVSGDRL